MKKPKKLLLALLFFLLLMSSVNPTNSQKKGQQGSTTESAPVARPAQAAKDSTDTVPVPVQSSRLDSVAAKAEKVEQVFDKVDKKFDQGSRQLTNIQIRQMKTLHSLIYNDAKISPAMLPKPSPRIQVDPDKPQIKPVEVERPGWWKRTFGHD